MPLCSMDVRKYRTLHRHTYLACNSHYQIFLSCLQSTLSDDPSYMWFIPPNSPLCLQFILTTIPSYLQFTRWNNPSILAVHTIEYFYQAYSHTINVPSYLQFTLRIFLSCLQFTLSNIPTILVIHTIEHPIMLTAIPSKMPSWFTVHTIG
jgi:hypothetical protein